MYPQQKPPANMRKWYRSILEGSSIIVLVLLVTAFYGFPRFTPSDVLDSGYVPPIQTIELPPLTDPFEKPPQPARPAIPISGNDEEIAEDLPFAETNLANYQPLKDLPPLVPIVDRIFIKYDKKPTPIGGYAALVRNVMYPEIAREAGIQGKVCVEVIITKTGEVRDPRITEGIPNTGLNEAAIAAIMKTKWNPAYQRDKPVSVKILIPIDFRLN